jgi:hypothetical protein
MSEESAVPRRVHRKIELERRRLNQASAVLKCLNVAFNEGAEVDFGDVAIVAYTIIDSVIDELDIVTLERVRAHGLDSDAD